jgi:hypothetical protein
MWKVGGGIRKVNAEPCTCLLTYACGLLQYHGNEIGCCSVGLFWWPKPNSNESGLTGKTCFNKTGVLNLTLLLRSPLFSWGYYSCSSIWEAVIIWYWNPIKIIAAVFEKKRRQFVFWDRLERPLLLERKCSYSPYNDLGHLKQWIPNINIVEPFRRQLGGHSYTCISVKTLHTIDNVFRRLKAYKTIKIMRSIFLMTCS